MLRDGALALPACLLIATLTVGVAGLVRRARAAEWWAAGGRVARYGLLFAIAAPAFVLSMQGAEQARALAGPGQPCPTDAPVKHFSVTALDVKIPLNRFGDNDPAGKMYALDEAIPAVRAQEASGKVSIGLRDDAIQPLVVRANLGDCVEITYTNHASGGEYGVHIDGLAFNMAPPATPSAQHPSSVAGRQHAAPTASTSRATRSSRARTTCAPAPATARPSRTACSAPSPSSPRARRTCDPTPACRSSRAGRR